MLAIISSLALLAAPSDSPTRATAASAGDSLQSLFSDGDYPAEALERNQEGTVGVMLHVKPTGAVGSCTVEKSSGSTILDTRTCELLQQRAKFEPATDSQGRAFSAEFHAKIVWQIHRAPSETWATRMIMTFAPDGRLISCQRKLDGRLKNPVTNFSSECPDDQMLHSAPEVEALPGHVDMVVFESRFTIGNPAAVPTPDGEILFARQVLKLNVGAEGKLRSCQVVENSGPDSDADACAAMPNVYFPRTGSDGKAFAFTATVTRSVYMHVEQVTH